MYGNSIYFYVQTTIGPSADERYDLKGYNNKLLLIIIIFYNY